MGSSIGLSRVSRVVVSKPDRSHANTSNVLTRPIKTACAQFFFSPSNDHGSILIEKFQDYETISANKLAEFSSD